MRNYYMLDLPSNPLTPDAYEKVLADVSDRMTNPHQSHFEKPNWNEYTDRQFVTSAFRSDVLEILGKVGLEPRVFLVFFGSDGPCAESGPMVPRGHLKGGFVHKDVAFYNNQWESIPFAINFDINPSTTLTLSWYDTEGVPGHFDDLPEIQQKRKYLCGVRYSADHNECMADDLGLNLLDRITIKGGGKPMLVRTDVAHSATAYTEQGNRCNISLRFSLGKKYSYQQALDMLKPMISSD